MIIYQPNDVGFLEFVIFVESMPYNLMKTIIVTVLFVAVAAISFALPDPGGGEFPCGGEFGPCPIPIDGGVGILLASGIALGGAKWFKEKRSHKQ